MNQSSPLKTLKYPGLGLFASFKYVFLVILSIFKYAIRGFTYVFIDIPVTIWNNVSNVVFKLIEVVLVISLKKVLIRRKVY